MLFTRLVLASSSLLAVALAQSKVAFTGVPAIVKAGETYNITWGGGNDTPVTLTLRKGDPNNLDTIEILADGIRGDSYEWEVDEDLDTASDYALQITQGQSDINYSGQFSLSGGKGSSSIPYTASSTSTTSENSTSTTSSDSSSITNGTSSSTESSNSTESSTTMESSTTSESSSSTTTGSSSSSSRTAGTPSNTDIAQQTNAPDSASSATQVGSSIAFAMAVLGAVVMMN